MGSTNNYNSDSLLRDLGGCGKYQILLTIFIELSAFPSFFSFNIDIFNIYNPGWKCVGNDTSSNISTDVSTNTTNGTTDFDKMWTEYGIHSCEAFDSCSHVQFSPEASTLVTEWGLTCSKGFIMSTILSIRMAGYLCSTLIVGYIGDRFGRRMPFLISRVIIFCLNLIYIFCESWQAYATVSFIMGFVACFGLLEGTILTEYVSPDWRIKIYSMPAWAFVASIFAIVCRFFPYWRTLRLIVVVTGFIALIPMFLILPESLRWVSVYGQKETLIKMISKVAKVNKTPLPEDNKIQSLIQKNESKSKKQNYTVFHLFRKGYRLSSFIIAFLNFSIDVVYYAFSFGVAALPGNFYDNLLIFAATDFPANILAFAFANKFPRKPTTFANFLFCALSIFGIVAIDRLATGEFKTLGTLGLVTVAKLFIYIGWIVLSTSQIEIYPTVVRSTVRGYAFFFSSLGGIVAPYLIPSDPDVFYICYLAMAILTLICAVLLLFFQETKGKTLKDRWNDGDDASLGGNDVLIIDAPGNKPGKRQNNLVV